MPALASVLQVAPDCKLFHVDTPDDCQQLIRHLAEHPVAPPLWRQQRPALLVEQASYQAETGTLCLNAYVRYAGLSANQLVTIPGAGDFQIAKITGPRDPTLVHRGHGQDMEVEGEDWGGYLYRQKLEYFQSRLHLQGRVGVTVDPSFAAQPIR